MAATGSAPNTPRQESAAPGIPAYQPLVQDHQVRLAGEDRTGTAIAVSKAFWSTPPVVGTFNVATSVVLTRSDDFADALGGSALAGHQGPLLLTPTATLDANVKNEIVRVLGPVDQRNPKTVYVLGGEKALSPAVEKAVRALGYQVQRVSGPDRYATSVAIAHAVTDFDGIFSGWQNAAPDNVGYATGLTWPDALSGGAYMSAAGGPLLLLDPEVTTNGNDVDGWLTGWSSSIGTATVFGGTKALSDAVAAPMTSEISGPAGFTTALNPKAS